MTYDSREETLAHQERVDWLLQPVLAELEERAERHDESKLYSPEKETYDKFTPKLEQSTYGSDEYKQFLVDMGPALQHHYEHNRHHPEHFGDAGINGMTLIDLMEMLADWKAATERHADGDLVRSFEIQANRFDISPQLLQILQNTADHLGWLD